MRDFGEEGPDIGIEYEVHLRAADPDDERVQRIVRAAPSPEPIREPEEVFLVDRAQHRSRGSLDDLVFEGRDRQRALAAVLLRNVAPPVRLRPVCSAFDPCVQVPDPSIEIPFVGLPYHAVHAGRGVTLDRVERRPEHGGVDMVQERCEPLLLPLPCCLPYATQRCDTLSRFCARRVLCWSAFPLAPALRSTDSVADCSALFIGFPATTTGSDFSGSCIAGHDSSSSRRGPTESSAGQTRDLPVPVQRASAHARVFDHAESVGRSRYRTFPCCLPR